jgi:hypothetical protein
MDRASVVEIAGDADRIVSPLLTSICRTDELAVGLHRAEGQLVGPRRSDW